jgi:hypothetical protein
LRAAAWGPSAEDLVSTSAERASLDALREAAGERGGPMERHGIRVFLIVERLASKEGATVDREVLLCASLLHDVGLYPRASEGGAYVTDGRHYAAGVLVSGRWSGDRLERCLDAIEHPEIARLLGRALRERPATLPRIFVVAGA